MRGGINEKYWHHHHNDQDVNLLLLYVSSLLVCVCLFVLLGKGWGGGRGGGKVGFNGLSVQIFIYLGIMHCKFYEYLFYIICFIF